jgi:hypothetical protein
MIRSMRALGMSLAALLLLSSIVLSACGDAKSTTSSAGTGRGSPPPAAHPDSGVRGRLLIGPTCAVEPAETPCVHPYQAAISIRSEPAGQLVAQLRSSAIGGFSVALAPGRYVLVASSMRGELPRSGPYSIVVTSHHYTTVTLVVGSGIRGVAGPPPGFVCANPVGCPRVVPRGSNTLLWFARDYLRNHVCFGQRTADGLAAAIAQELDAQQATTWQMAAYGICNPSR